MNKKLFRQGLATHLPFMMVAAAIFIVGCPAREKLPPYMRDMGMPTSAYLLAPCGSVNLGGGRLSGNRLLFLGERPRPRCSTALNSYQWARATPMLMKTFLEKDDVAHVKWGGKWRLPTKEEFAQLEDAIHNTTSNTKPYQRASELEYQEQTQ